MTLTTICLSALFISLKILTTHSNIQPYEVSYWQGLFGCLTFLIILSIKRSENKEKDNFDVPKDVRKFFILRGVFGFLGNLSASTSTKLTTLANFTVVFYTNPIFVCLVGLILAKERLTPYDYVGIFTTFSGVLVFMSN